MTTTPQSVWVSADGRMRALVRPDGRLKGGRLFDAFHGIHWDDERGLTGSKSDLARAYRQAVWAYRCVKMRADAVASVPLVLLDRDGVPINEHPLLTLLRDVNPHTMNLGDLLRATEAAYNIWGVAYWLVIRANSQSRREACSQVRYLQWLNPQSIEVVRDSQRGVIGYRQMVGGSVREFPAADVIAFRNFDPLDDLGGLSPLSVALNEINADLNAAQFVGAFFANDARPAGLLTTDQPLVESEVERVRTWWQTLFRGARNKWKTGIVGGGLKWQTITFPPTDLALSELRAEDRRAICAVFGVPPGLAGAWESTTYANAQTQKASFYEDTVLPQLNYIAEVLNWSLLAQYPDLTARGARLAWDTDSIAALREGAAEKAERLIALFQAGLITRNEARTALGLPALEADQDGFVGDVKPEEPPAQPDSKAAHNGRKSGAPGGAREDLIRWQRYALRHVREGTDMSNVRPFASDAIPPAVWWPVQESLPDAQNEADVRAIFDAAFAAVEEEY